MTWSAAGCSGRSQLAPLSQELFAPSLEFSLVMGSVSAPKVMHYWEVVTFRLIGENGRSYEINSASDTSGFMWFGRVPSQPGAATPDRGLESELGRLFLIELPPGLYRVEHRQARGPGADVEHQASPAITVPPASAIYLGNFNVRHCLYNGDGQHAYRGYIVGGRPQINDRRERDLSLLGELYPGLEAATVSSFLPDDSAWRSGSCPP